MIATKYYPSDLESKWYDYWMKNGFFHSEPDDREPYTIVIPPPNVTGVLHMGHMLNNTIQDILVRNARMKGKNTCWVPGTDHASIATEAKIVAKLAGEGIKKSELTREQFLEHAWEWTHKHGGIILEQLKKLGASCDWDRTCFTMDEKRSKSVIKVFVDLYNKGHIYRGVRMVNWDPEAKTALSDEEVNYKEQEGKMYYVRYIITPKSPEGDLSTAPHSEGGRYAVIATTRPETILGDTAVCINPSDPKNAHLKGKRVIVPVADRGVPIIEDEYVDMEFGTGCLKVTPAHDMNDYILGEKYKLPVLDIFNDNGTLNHHGLHYEGKDRFEVRRLIVEELTEKGLIEKIEPYENKVGFSERTNVPIEPKLSMQWFLKMEELAKPALEAVTNDTIRLIPAKFKNMYRHWMENIKDWCISRQLWWGHRIPAWYLPEGGFVVAETKEEAYQKALTIVNYQLSIDDLRQDEDCLDTWFSSWLWPISVFDGINEPDNKDIRYYYPTNDLVTAPEIIFFWVARMIISGYEYRREACFRNVYFTGIVRDKLGRKMSKSLGNSPDPIELMDKYGADGVRMGMLLTSPAGNDLPFDEALCEQGRSFCIKIWNVYRLVKSWDIADIMQPESALTANIAFRDKLSEIRKDLNNLYKNYKLSEAIKLLYSFFYDEFASTYLEAVKPEYLQPIDRKTYNNTINSFEETLKLLHPFLPFITEEIWQNIKKRRNGQSIMLQSITRGINKNEKQRQKFEKAKEIITNIRNIRVSKNISQHEKLTLEILGEHDGLFDEMIIKLAKVNIENVSKKSAGAISFMVGTTDYAVTVGNLINTAEELDRLTEELKYYQGLLELILKKLNNNHFVSKAPEKIIEIERKKQADTESKIKSLQENIATLEIKNTVN